MEYHAHGPYPGPWVQQAYPRAVEHIPDAPARPLTTTSTHKTQLPITRPAEQGLRSKAGGTSDSTQPIAKHRTSRRCQPHHREAPYCHDRK